MIVHITKPCVFTHVSIIDANGVELARSKGMLRFDLCDDGLTWQCEDSTLEVHTEGKGAAGPVQGLGAFAPPTVSLKVGDLVHTTELRLKVLNSGANMGVASRN